MRKKESIFAWDYTILTLLVLLVIGVILLSPTTAHASTSVPQAAPPGPDRYTSLKVNVTMYEWWIAAWRDGNVFCSFYTDYEGLPSDSDIKSACGQDLYDEWKTYSAPCLDKDITQCKGYYFIQVSKKIDKREITVKLPSPKVRVSVDGCQPDMTGWCTQQPSLVLTGEDPLPNQSITSVSGTAGSDPFSCNGISCRFVLSETQPTGIHMTFWANSTYGDTSPVFDALVRVKMDGNSGERLTPRWYVDVISSQWSGAPVASCASVWEAFPPTDGLSQWLTTPNSSIGLKSKIPLHFLSANLIKQGISDASACPNKGLNEDGSANSCGIKVSTGKVIEWQNRFDKLIFSTAKSGGVPAQLLKNLFSRESQFWPGVVENGIDVGLGQMTLGGADTAMLWNPGFYEVFCPLVLNKFTCQSKGFSKLNLAQQKMLRGALVGSVDARCETCPLGIDLTRADFSVGVFAHTLLANCEQAGTIVQNVTGEVAGHTLDYETLWRFTLVNYNAGSGCLASAVTAAYDPSAEIPLSWDGVANALEQSCPGAVKYVEEISKSTVPVPTVPALTPVPTATPDVPNG